MRPAAVAVVVAAAAFAAGALRVDLKTGKDAEPGTRWVAGDPADGPVARLYGALGVDRRAAPREIEAAARARIRAVHPDHGGTVAELEEVLEARRVLLDPVARAFYDLHGRAPVGAEAGAPVFNEARNVKRKHESSDTAYNLVAGHAGASVEFFYGRQPGEAVPVRHTDVAMKVSLEQVAKGATIKGSIDRKRRCPVCEGTGARSPADVVTCPLCEGRGLLASETRFGAVFQQEHQQLCPKCAGETTVVAHTCKKCGGAKLLQEKFMASVEIPKGMPEGFMVDFPGEGDEGPETPAGNMRVRVGTSQHKVFVREGDNLLFHTNITLSEALTGFSRDIPTLYGRTVNVRKDTVTQPNERVVVRGEGLPRYDQPDKRGDIIVQLGIEYPDEVSSSQRSVLGDVF